MVIKSKIREYNNYEGTRDCEQTHPIVIRMYLLSHFLVPLFINFYATLSNLPYLLFGVFQLGSLYSSHLMFEIESTNRQIKTYLNVNLRFPFVEKLKTSPACLQV